MIEQPSDAELMARISRNDPAALGELYDQFAPRVFGLLIHILPSRDEAEEILREVFERLGTENQNLGGEGGSVAAWLVVTSRAAALERLRAQRHGKPRPGTTSVSEGMEKAVEKIARSAKASTSPAVSGKAAPKSSEVRTPAGKASPVAPVRTGAMAQVLPAWLPRSEEIAVIDGRLELLHKVVNQLPKSQREALEFAVFRGLGEAEIAAELGEPLGKVRTGLRAAVTFVKHRRRAILGTWAANL